MKPRAAIRRASDGSAIWVVMLPYDLVEGVGFVAGIGHTVAEAYGSWIASRQRAEAMYEANCRARRRRMRRWDPVFRKGLH